MNNGKTVQMVNRCAHAHLLIYSVTPHRSTSTFCMYVCQELEVLLVFSGCGDAAGVVTQLTMQHTHGLSQEERLQQARELWDDQLLKKIPNLKLGVCVWCVVCHISILSSSCVGVAVRD